MMRRVAALAFPVVVVACATAQPAPVCPAPTRAATSRAPEAASPQGPPVSELLARMPRGADVLVRVDVQRLFGTRLGRMGAPFLVWSREYARYREACTERPWEVLRSVEGAYGESGVAAALLGPVAAEGNACAPAVLGAPDVGSLRTGEAGGGASLVMGADAARPALAGARGGAGSAADDEAFAGMPPGMAQPLAVVLVRGAAYREAMDYVASMQDEATGERTAGRPPLPHLALASTEQLRALRGARIEAGLAPSGDLDLRMSLLFPTSGDAERYVAASRDDMRVRMPEYLSRVVLREMRENPDAPRAMQGFTPELVSWFEEMAPMQARGPVVEVSFGGSGSTTLTLGVLSAVAIPAFTRYVKRSKTAEAVTNVGALATSLATTLNRLPPARRRLAAIAATPSEAPSGTRYAADTARWATPAWQRVGFGLTAAHYYQYRVDVDGRCYVAAASGDLDGDGTRSTFSRRVCPLPNGSYEAGPLQVADELE